MPMSKEEQLIEDTLLYISESKYDDDGDIDNDDGDIDNDDNGDIDNDDDDGDIDNDDGDGDIDNDDDIDNDNDDDDDGDNDNDHEDDGDTDDDSIDPTPPVLPPPLKSVNTTSTFEFQSSKVCLILLIL